MAAVPTGPSGALATPPVEIPPFPGDGEGVEPVSRVGLIAPGRGCEGKRPKKHPEASRRRQRQAEQVNGVTFSARDCRQGSNCCPPSRRSDNGDSGSLPGHGELELLARLRLEEEIGYVRYESELQMPGIMRLITRDLSEPYSIYTYRYFIHNWPQLCFLAMVEKECVGAIVCKLDMHKKMFRRGYIAMLAVDSKHRRKSIGTNLVKKAIYAMVEGDCDEVVLETEITNKSALKLYENLGFVRDKRLFRYYLNGVDALRLKLWLR
ncbi:N-alpha-acetyltransferase 30-like [Denticeps clupeoides]|uniref:N-alpha-acetyltransferase 30 n=1 Tax=Denticeps clupeoides TaxID=299321 RepID=A0AAY4BWM5_9TELE|nr:N-alpha-acetyltransferase 30-like [Denticeps clupeoides]